MQSPKVSALCKLVEVHEKSEGSEREKAKPWKITSSVMKSSLFMPRGRLTSYSGTYERVEFESNMVVVGLRQ